MNKQDNREANHQQILLEDLTVNEDQAAAVNGGGSAVVFVGGWGASSYQYAS